jgi:hypothetical protein
MRHSRNALLAATTLVALSTLAHAQQCPTLPPVEVIPPLPVPSGTPDTGPVLRPTPDRAHTTAHPGRGNCSKPCTPTHHQYRCESL